jgi:hypothetical protein
LIETHINYPDDLLKDCISFLANSIISPIEFIHNSEEINENNVEIYKSLVNDPFIKSLFLKNIIENIYYTEIINKVTSSINNENYKLVKEIIDNIDISIKKEYKDSFYGDTLLHLAILLTSIDREFALSWINNLVDEDIDINSVENTNRTILHTLVYNSIDVFSNIEYDEDKENIEFMLKNLLKIDNIDIDLTDNNGLTILHLILMIKYDNITELVDLILSLNPDLYKRSLYPVKATPLQIAILYKQDDVIINKIKEKLTSEEFSSQSNTEIVSHVDDIYNASIDISENKNKKIQVKYIKEIEQVQKEEKKEEVKEEKLEIEENKE